MAGITTRSRSARERILAAARTLFYRDGIHATGVERLAKHAQVSKRTLYQHFSSKDRVVEEYLRRIHDTGGMPNEKALAAVDATPRNRLLANFDATALATSLNDTAALLHARSAAEVVIDAAVQPGSQVLGRAAKSENARMTTMEK